jgi:hypothetical protein
VLIGNQSWSLAIPHDIKLQVASTNKTDSHRHDIIEIIIESGAKHLNPAIWHFCDTKKDLIEDHPRNIPVTFAVH